MTAIISTKRAYNGLEDYASAHHVTGEIFAAAGWTFTYHLNRPALMFKTASGPRYRFLDNLEPRYRHESGYKACWYGLQRAVNMDKPYIVDCNGAPSTVVAQHYGIPAFSLQVGEGAKLTDELIQQVKQVWSGPIVVAFDCDSAGRAASQRRIWDWRRAGIECYAVDLGITIEGGDLADFAALNRNICDCPHLDIPPEPVKPVGTRHANTTETADDLMHKAEFALDALSIDRCNDMQLWIQVGMALKETLGDAALPLWENWSARSDKFKPGVCEKRWRTFKRHDLSIGSLFAWADLDSGKSWRERLRKKTTKSAKNRPAPIGLPDSIRSALLNYAHACVAPVAELWYEAVQTGRLKADEIVDAKQLALVGVDLKRAISTRTLYTGLSYGTNVFFAKVEHVLDPESTDILTGTSNDRGVQGGRKSEKYSLLPMSKVTHNLAGLSVKPILEKAFPPDSEALAPVCTGFLESLGMDGAQAQAKADELRKRYGKLITAQPGYREAIIRAKAEYRRLIRSFANPASTPIPHDLPMGSGGDYVASFARSTVLAAKGQTTQKGRAWWRERLGAKDKALPLIWKRAGIVVEKKVLAERPIASVSDLPTTADYDFDRAGKPQELVSSKAKKPLKFDPCPPLVRWVQEQLEAGATVTLLYHQANRQRLAPPPKRLVYAAIAAVERIIGWIADLFKPKAKQLSFMPDEPEHESSRPPEPQEPEPVDERFTLKKQPSSRPTDKPPSYAERWLNGLLGRVLTNEYQESGLEPEPIEPMGIQLTFELLLAPTGAGP